MAERIIMHPAFLEMAYDGVISPATELPRSDLAETHRAHVLKTMCILFDISGVTEFGYDVMERAGWLQRLIDSGIRVAMLSTREDWAAMARATMNLIGVSSLECRVFDTRADAESWLCSGRQPTIPA